MMKLFVTVLIATAFSVNLNADCVHDCSVALDAADKTIHARDLTITTLEKSRDDLLKDNLNLREEKNRADASRTAWYHNPFVLVPLGIIGGVVLDRYLEKK